MMSILAPIALALSLQAPAAEAPAPPTTEQMIQQASSIAPRTGSAFAKALLSGYGCLPSIKTRSVYFNRDTRTALSDAEATKMTADQLTGFAPRNIDEQYYYFTRYGTPVAFVRPVEILGKTGVKGPDGLKLVDFGFGSIGQLRALASMGADVSGIEVDPILKVIYAGEPGAVDRCAAAGKGRRGSINLAFGQFPADPAIVKQIGTGYDVFISKNTLKRGYIHPEHDVDPRMLVHLDVDDEAFVHAVYDLLKPGGYFMIYNLCPAPSKPDEEYKPWGDGRSPFARATYEKAGFKVLAFDVDDTEAARAMGKTFEWGSDEDLAKDLFGIYTLVQKQ
jgi:hypothetical protein